MPKVLHLIHSLNRGGIEIWLLSMLRQIPRKEWEMDFCCKGQDVGPLAGIAEQLGAQVLHCQLSFAHVGFIQKLKRILTEGNYQILHNHLEAYSGLAVWLGRQLGIPVITSFHNTNFFTPQTPLTRTFLIRELRSVYAMVSVRYALHHSHLVTGCSQGVINSLATFEKNIQIPYRILYYGVNIPELSTPEECAELRRSFGWPGDTPLLLHVGRLIEQKNHLGLLSIFERVLEQIPNAKLLLVGEGPLQSLIEETIAKRGLENAVRLLGLRDDVPSLMSKSNVFLLPSFHEGLPVVSLEASAAGLPIVGSKIPGLIEAVRDRETAILHDVEDIDGMAKSTIEILRDRQYAEQLAHAGRTRIINNFSIENSAKGLTEIYKSFV
ncbi:glycosyltransferase [Calothrix sp. NIES-2098]|uniref:glycosyltransferase n=1 Tax=Calothrix sp. NIES-2098 TaxID=1954171 RepID=UPI000B5EB832|nr:glycosyl transferase, group 1 family protein [Calothrix sp. NIES-2098]